MFFMDIATNIVDTLLEIMLIQHLTQRCATHKNVTVLYFLCNMIALSTLNWFDTPGVFCSLTSLLITTVYCLILTNTFSQSIFLPTVFALAVSLSEGMVVTLVQWFFPPGTVSSIMQTDLLLIGCMVSSRLILAIIVLMVNRFIPINLHISRRNWFLLCLSSIYLFVINMMIVCHMVRTFDFQHILPLLLVGICIVCFAFLQFGISMTKQNAEKSRLHNELMQSKVKLRQQDEMVSLYQKLQGLQHDYRNHLQILSSLAQKNNQQELMDYINGLSDVIAPTSAVVSTGNVYIDAIINAKCLTAEKNHVGLRLEVQMPDTLTIPPSDICMLISNILDNGLEACMNNKNVDHRILNFYIAQQKGFLLISSHNYAEQSLEKTRFSSLHNTSIGGCGLQQIKRLVKQYNGHCEYNINEHIFHIQVLLPHAVDYNQIFVSQSYPNTKVCNI